MAAADAAKLEIEDNLRQTIIALEAANLTIGNSETELKSLKEDIQSSDAELDETKIALAASLARQQRLELELSNLSQNINEKTAQFKDYSEKLTIAESDLASALMALEQEKLSRQTFEDDSVQDITDLRSKLADALAARWAAVQSQKEALENLKNVLQLSLFRKIKCRKQPQI